MFPNPLIFGLTVTKYQPATSINKITKSGVQSNLSFGLVCRHLIMQQVNDAYSFVKTWHNVNIESMLWFFKTFETTHHP